MSLDLAAVFESAATVVRGAVARDVTVYPFDPGSGARSYPCITFEPREPWVEYHETHGDNRVEGINFDTVVFVAGAKGDAMLALASFASDASASGSSIRRAVETADSNGRPSLGGVVAYAICYRCGVPEQVEGDDAQGVWRLAFECHAKESRS